jgi:hypothetical protein
MTQTLNLRNQTKLNKSTPLANSLNSQLSTSSPTQPTECHIIIYSHYPSHPASPYPSSLHVHRCPLNLPPPSDPPPPLASPSHHRPLTCLPPRRLTSPTLPPHRLASINCPRSVPPPLLVWLPRHSCRWCPSSASPQAFGILPLPTTLTGNTHPPPPLDPTAHLLFLLYTPATSPSGSACWPPSHFPSAYRQPPLAELLVDHLLQVLIPLSLSSSYCQMGDFAHKLVYSSTYCYEGIFTFTD